MIARNQTAQHYYEHGGGDNYVNWSHHRDHHCGACAVLLLYPSAGDQGAHQGNAHAQGAQVALLGEEIIIIVIGRTQGTVLCLKTENRPLSY